MDTTMRTLVALMPHGVTMASLLDAVRPVHHSAWVVHFWASRCAVECDRDAVCVGACAGVMLAMLCPGATVHDSERLRVCAQDQCTTAAITGRDARRCVQRMAGRESDLARSMSGPHFEQADDDAEAAHAPTAAAASSSSGALPPLDHLADLVRRGGEFIRPWTDTKGSARWSVSSLPSALWPCVRCGPLAEAGGEQGQGVDQPNRPCSWEFRGTGLVRLPCDACAAIMLAVVDTAAACDTIRLVLAQSLTFRSLSPATSCVATLLWTWCRPVLLASLAMDDAERRQAQDTLSAMVRAASDLPRRDRADEARRRPSRASFMSTSGGGAAKRALASSISHPVVCSPSRSHSTSSTSSSGSASSSPADAGDDDSSSSSMSSPSPFEHTSSAPSSPLEHSLESPKAAFGMTFYRPVKKRR